MNYIFIDTNNWKYCALQIRKNNNPETLTKLKEILKKNGNIELIMPETIDLEVLKVVYISFVKEIEEELNALKAHIGKNYEKHISQPLIEEANNIIQKRKESKEKALLLYKKIKEKSCVYIPLDSELILKAEKRRIRGRKPSNGTHKKDQDCYALESIISYLQGIDEKEDSILYFCSNDSNFIEEDYKLHKEIRNDLNIKTKHYRFLHELLTEEFHEKIDQKEKEDIEKMETENKIEDHFELIIRKIDKEVLKEEKERLPEQKFINNLKSEITYIDKFDKKETNYKKIYNYLKDLNQNFSLTYDQVELMKRLKEYIDKYLDKNKPTNDQNL